MVSADDFHDGVTYTTLTDPVSGTFLDLVPGHPQDVLAATLRARPGWEGIEVFVMDGCKATRAAVRAFNPRIVVAADRFHMEQLVMEALQGLRRLLAGDIALAFRRDKDEDGIAANLHHRLKRHWWDLDEAEREHLGQVFDRFPLLGEA
ncbi:transposase, putative [Rhodospirillum centenum SW]|uniref:Transposase, putative n=1 Tax=Rhodospirillum centenum (strain ATCC 51521 / SW) TaxID=414684 RepID=B6IPR9_RHOCS|nr:transposase, putative [Rhodospirillum centenum SW]